MPLDLLQQLDAPAELLFAGVTASHGDSLSSCRLLCRGLLSNSPVGEELVSEQTYHTGCGKTLDANRVVSALFRLLINSVAACKYLIVYVTA